MSGGASFALCLAKRRTNSKHWSDHRPPTSHARVKSLTLPRDRAASRYFLGLRFSALSIDAPGTVRVLGWGVPSALSGDTCVTSHKSGTPPQNGNPKQANSTFLLSFGSTPSFISRSFVFLTTRPPASAQTCAQLASVPFARSLTLPERMQEAKWSPLLSRNTGTRQFLFPFVGCVFPGHLSIPNGRSNRSRLRNKHCKCESSKETWNANGTVWRNLAANRPPWERSRACAAGSRLGRKLNSKNLRSRIRDA